MKQTVEHWIRQRYLLPPGSKVLAAVSGGPDSMALLHLLKTMEQTWNLTVMAAHVHHGLREDTADRDEQFVKQWCEQQNIPFFHTRVSVEKKMAEEGGGVQEQARILRYEYLAGLMEEESVSVLAAGHHADDQIETMLMKQTSGRALLGETAIKAARPFAGGTLIRPLLGVTKEEIYTYCREHVVPFQEDESNQSDKYQRNRIRRHVLPALKEEEPFVHRHFQRFADWMEEERSYMESLAEEEWSRRIISKNEHSVTISIKGMEALPLPLQRRGIPLILKYLYTYSVPELSVVHIEQFLALVQGEHPSAVLDWPGSLVVRRSYNQVTLEDLSLQEENREGPGPVRLPVPGNVSYGDYVMEAAFSRPDGAECNEDFLILDEEETTFPLYIRPRRDGDRIIPIGMTGSKKVNRILIDEKVPLRQRPFQPVVTDAEGIVLWLPFVKKSAHHLRRGHPPQKRPVFLTCRRVPRQEQGDSMCLG
ncbi:tRNA lysidine(34) synthetase TilS [Salibacterium halotolerans]|uniref:tRNA(Ile)-lysidine synthase n=1 Tax=Salibacterium halotolerans TaxID=1884432 RepID=A0A1I5WKU1_9BACI|nr:tRNA lysidine(34) synthetase TilS [Salibacterium halotolerans]SFQ20201.1 tRNA(Ile)-lysidine synthase [Salibacterium halotolerans]